MHYPGCELDRNRGYYEQKYGSRFLSPEWWKEDLEQFENSQRNIPSSDLADDVELARRMLNDRDLAMKRALALPAYRFAANKYFPHWQNDPEYKQS
jgi:hypothetical protein